MALSSVSLSQSASAACFASHSACRMAPHSSLLAGSSQFVALSCFLLREGSVRRKLESRRVGCTGSRAQLGADVSTPTSVRRDTTPAIGPGKSEREEDRNSQPAEEQRLVPAGDGDDPEAVGAISLCLDAIGTMDIDEMEECLAMADSLSERKSKASS